MLKIEGRVDMTRWSVLPTPDALLPDVNVELTPELLRALDSLCCGNQPAGYAVELTQLVLAAALPLLAGCTSLHNAGQNAALFTPDELRCMASYAEFNKKYTSLDKRQRMALGDKMELMCKQIILTKD